MLSPSVGTKVPIPGESVFFFGTRTSVRAESGKKVAIVGTEVPIPGESVFFFRNPYFSAGFRLVLLLLP